MTLLKNTTPSPAQLADAWEAKFGPTIRKAAGADGRLTINEARKIARLDGPGFLASDNASNWLKFSGQKTVSANKLVRVIRDYVEREAAKVAGSNNKVSLAEGRKLPADVRADFFYLRGKGLPKHRSGAQLATIARQMVADKLEPFSLTKLTKVPSSVRGERRLALSVKFPGDPLAQAHVFIGRDNVVYTSIAATSMSPNLPRVGWYRVGPVPA